MKKTKDQLRKDFADKIDGLKALLNFAESYPLESNLRIEISRNIANTLRAVLFGDRCNNGLNLIERCGYSKTMIFPCLGITDCLNLMPTYSLLSFTIKDKKISTTVKDDVGMKKVCWHYYLDVNSWLNEVVIDTKLEGVKPMTRLYIIKTVSDKQGAHVDNDIDDEVYLMQHSELFPIIIQESVGEKNYEVKANSIFCESIIGIAKELIFSFEEYLEPKLEISGKHIFAGIIQSYKIKGNYKFYKYGTVNESTKTYNSNSYFECDVYQQLLSDFKIKSKTMRFVACILHCDRLLEGEYKGKMIYNSF